MKHENWKVEDAFCCIIVTIKRYLNIAKCRHRLIIKLTFNHVVAYSKIEYQKCKNIIGI